MSDTWRAAPPPVLARTTAELAAARADLDAKGGPVVLVPTMGALHAGHERLLRAARTLAGPRGSVIVSIFVNPLQFGPNEDLDRYPRTLDEDLAMCGRAGARLVFAPSAAQMYPGGRPEVTVDPGPMGQLFEGEFRPGFFGGVLTVVLKLLHLTRPAIAVFGQKDAQQLTLVRRMVTDLDLGVVIEPVPTARDADGLATSSRNRYLSAADRAVALALPRALLAGQARAAEGGDAGAVLASAQDVLRAEPALTVDYVAVVDPGTFGPVGTRQPGPALLVAAARAGGTRLIDNMPVVLTAEGTAGGGPHDAATEGPAMLLTIDIGNTNTVLGVFEADRVIEHWRIATVPDRTADELAVVLHGLLAASSAFTEREINGISLCSTVPSVLHEMREMCERYYGDLETVIVEPGVKTGVPVRTDNPKEVGSDRIMNSLAAVHLYGGPAIVVDFGTSTNFDAVSARGEFVGGALAPGIEISVDALSRRAAQLLKVELTRPPRVIGKNTVESLQSGIIYGFAAQVEGITLRMARELSPDDPSAVTTIATGGLAPLVIDEVSVIDAYEPWLTLIGLRLVYERNAAQADSPGPR